MNQLLHLLGAVIEKTGTLLETSGKKIQTYATPTNHKEPPILARYPLGQYHELERQYGKERLGFSLGYMSGEILLYEEEEKEQKEDIYLEQKFLKPYPRLIPTPPQKPVPTPEQEPVPTPEQEPVPTPEQEPVPTPEQEPVPTPEQEPVPTPEQEPVPTPEQEPVPTPEPKKKDFIVLDIETTGLPPRKTSFKNYEAFNNCRVVQIGLYTEGVERMWILKPDGFVIKNDFIHGVSQARANREGQSREQVFSELLNILRDYKTIVCHNVYFDRTVLASEMYRFNPEYGLEFYNMKFHCSMLAGQKMFHLSKWPKLTELHKLLFKKDVVQTHDALDDCRLTYKCFSKMQQ